jgi:hypothetical protein
LEDLCVDGRINTVAGCELDSTGSRQADLCSRQLAVCGKGAFLSSRATGPKEAGKTSEHLQFSYSPFRVHGNLKVVVVGIVGKETPNR